MCLVLGKSGALYYRAILQNVIRHKIITLDIDLDLHMSSIV